MVKRLTTLAVALLMAAGAFAAPPRTPAQMKASYEAHKNDFDYLLGDWKFDADSKEYGKFGGYWSAVRLPEGQIVDEYRVVDPQGKTVYVTTTFRNYNYTAERWELIGADGGAGLQDFGTAEKVGGEMHIEQTYGVAAGTPAKWRIRYYAIGADRFSWSADRSLDGGKTWTKDYQKIESRRIGPKRELGSLTHATK
jgi:hypothetical protein